MIQKKQNQNDLTIGFLTDWIEQRYQATIYKGIADIARLNNANLISFVIGSLNEPYEFIAQRNVIADLINPEKLDGLIVMSGALSNYVDYQDLISFIDKYQPLPMTSIGLPITDFPSVLIDNKKGMREALIHLIEVHHFHRIAFIRGPSGHQEAEDRYQSYKEVLSEYKIPLDPRLVMDGDFNWTSGAKAIYELLNIRKLHPKTDFEAIVASNDFMALSALETLTAQGIKVPEEVAVIGFDNIEETTLVMPPLTTVRQPLYQMGKHAAEIMLTLLNGRDAQKEIVLPTKLTVRRSCGCLSYNVQQIGPSKLKSPKNTHTKSTTFPRKIILEEMNKALGIRPQELSSEWAEALLDKYAAEVRGINHPDFIIVLDRLLRNIPLNDINIDAWHEIISVLYHQTIPLLANDPHALSIASGLLQQARVLIGEIGQQIISNQVFLTERRSIALSQFNASLVTTYKIPDIVEIITEELLRLNIKSCYLVLYDETENKVPSDWSRLILAYDEYERKDLGINGLRFTSKQLLPDNILPRNTHYALAVFPLFVQETQLGYILFEIEREVRRIYETIRYQISSALKGALFLQERQRTAKELARSNKELEQFAYIASHDLQEPLRAISSYAQLLEKKLKNNRNNDINTFLYYLMEGAQRMQTMIQDLLLYSRVSRRTTFQINANLNSLIDKVIKNLSFTIKEKNASIRINTLPEIKCDPVKMERLFQNLINNALKYCNKKPEVVISAKQKEAEWEFSIEDNGIGINQEYINEIFGIFKRLHSKDEFKGTGIGLSICKKIVEQHGGEIWAESDGEEKGSTFLFKIPIR
ncbi:substrate-binding domain-containing protein [bacterium]|nr:substrate-binding domain-containing protein [bacterium]